MCTQSGRAPELSPSVRHTLDSNATSKETARIIMMRNARTADLEAALRTADNWYVFALLDDVDMLEKSSSMSCDDAGRQFKVDRRRIIFSPRSNTLPALQSTVLSQAGFDCEQSTSVSVRRNFSMDMIKIHSG
jgi:hypothetical protein